MVRFCVVLSSERRLPFVPLTFTLYPAPPQSLVPAQPSSSSSSRSLLHHKGA